MIYWLNGAYGVGKTTVSKHLVKMLRNGHVFDPELIGDGIRDNYPESLFFETYEQYPLWLELNYKLLKDLCSRYDGDIVAPMTLLKKESYEAIIKRLKNDGIDVCYIYLDADEKTLRHRLIDLGHEKPDSWCVQHISICLEVQREDRFAIHIDTVGKTPEMISNEIIAAGMR